MTRDDLNPELRERYDKLIEEFSEKVDKIPEYTDPYFNNVLARKPYEKLEEKYLPRLKALFREAEKAMKVSSEEKI